MREEENRKHFIAKVARAAGAPGGIAENLSPFRLNILSLDDEVVHEKIPGIGASGVAVDGVKTDGRGPRGTRHSDGSSEQYDIPYKAVVQARQERVLVGAFLRRYARGEDKAYVKLERGGDEQRYLVGGKFPGVYYRPVKVCSNCHMVYALIDGARAQALRRVRGGGGGGCGGGESIGRRQRTEGKLGPSRPAIGDATRDIVDSMALQKDPVSEGHSTAVKLSLRLGDGKTVEDDSKTDCPERKDADFEHSPQALSLKEARRAIGTVTQGDVSELRSLSRPPSAIAHVASVAIALLEQRRNDDIPLASWAHAKIAMGRSDFFLRLRMINPRAVTRCQLRAADPAVESPSFRPRTIRPFSNAAANLCLWVLGVVQANRWMTGNGHVRTNIVPPGDYTKGLGNGSDAVGQGYCATTTWFQNPSFYPPLLPVERQRLRRKRGRIETREFLDMLNTDRGRGGDGGVSVSLDRAPKDHLNTVAGRTNRETVSVLACPATSPVLGSGSNFGCEGLDSGGAYNNAAASTPMVNRGGRAPPGGGGGVGGGQHRKCGAGSKVTAQAFASSRLTNPEQSSVSGSDAEKAECVCSDGKTQLPYRVCGERGTSGNLPDSCNFIVVHDFFDNVDKTEVLFRPVTRQHRGCRVLSFSYPGQSGTVFEIPPSMVAQYPPRNRNGDGGGGAPGGSRAAIPEPNGVERAGISSQREVPNNAFIAPKMHELLQHVHSIGDMSLTSPFHLVSSAFENAILFLSCLRSSVQFRLLSKLLYLSTYRIMPRFELDPRPNHVCCYVQNDF